MSGPALVLLAGCATFEPESSRSTVQSHLAARGGLVASWPVSAKEKSEAELRVAELLAGDLTAAAAVQIALLNNRELRATFEEIGLSQADLISASRMRNPTFSVGARWPEDPPRVPHLELSVAAELLDNLLIPLRRGLAREQLVQAERRVADEVLALAAEVSSAVFTAQASQLVRDRFAAIGEVNAAAAELGRRQFEAGNINRLELANIQVAAHQAQLELTRAEAELRREREEISRLLSLSGEQTGWKLTVGLPDLPPVDASLAELETRGEAQRLDVAAAKGDLAIAEAALRLKRNTRLLPVSVVGLEVEREADRDRLLGGSLEIGLPLFEQGQAEIARLESEVRRATSRYEGLALGARSEVRAARDAVQAARQIAEFYAGTLLPQRERLLHETLLHYNAMQLSNYELLAARERQLLTEREAIEARRDYWIARTRLERALGGALIPSPVSGGGPGASSPSTPAAASHQHH